MEIEIEMGSKKKEGYDEYEIKSCAETLIKAEEIKKDEKKMKAIHAYLSKKKKAISSIADIKSAYKEKSMEDDS